MVTLVIPTRNRSDYLLRALSYYCAQQLPYRVVVADSSDPNIWAETEQALSRIVGLDLEYQWFAPDTPFLEKLARIVEPITTPFLQLSGDDDFFIPGALHRAAQFLRDHMDYALVVGDACVFTVVGDSAFGRVESSARYRQRGIEAERAVDRVRDHFTAYSTTWYAMHRTDNWRAHIAQTIAIEPDLHFMELLQSALSVASGKVKKLDELVMARQQVPVKQYSIESMGDWPSRKDWDQQFDLFTTAVGNVIRGLDGMALDDARAAVRDSFGSYLDEFVAPATTFGGRMRGIARRLPPVLASTWQRLARRGGDMGLPSLRAPESKYHVAFEGVERAVSTR